MTNEASFARLSEIQDEILNFTIEQVVHDIEKIYVQGKITDDLQGNVTSYEGVLKYAVEQNRILNNSEVLTREALRENSAFISLRIVELHDILRELQGKSPVRFRWAMDTKTGQVESDWAYYEDLTEEEKKDDFWQHWEGDFAWKAKLQAELAGQ
ncbi:hypothetical protein J2Y69_000074 [Microbacterium resistens]|uniref:Uncharacterized protein n=1 Tax=Microbacterium resistens TaxID=156977 RepID=A0ABU1S9J0_9MICO|nr:hypothetical protein [Microbacterium resistens]MDR6865492.1 hypothetical protein [Microbacterium resistens]